MTRNKDDFITGSYKFQGSDNDSTNYFTGTGENVIGTQSGAYAKVIHPKTSFYVPGESGVWGSTNERIEGLRSGESHKDLENRLDESPKNHWSDISESRAKEWADDESDSKGNIPLFGVQHNPPVLDILYSTKDSQNEATKLTAHAVEDARRRFGERPLASNNTSPYATEFVNTAIRHGLIKGVEGEPEGELASIGNNVGWADAAERIHGKRGDVLARLENPDVYRNKRAPVEISQAEMQTDRKNLVLEALSGKSSATRPSRSRQFKQGDLFSEK